MGVFWGRNTVRSGAKFWEIYPPCHCEAHGP